MTAVDAVRRDGHVELAVENIQYGVSGVFLCLRDAMHKEAITPAVLLHRIYLSNQETLKHRQLKAKMFCLLI